MKTSTKALILLLAISGSALANDAGILRCRGIAEASARLACYDALAVPATEVRAVPGKPAQQTDPRAAQTAPSAPSSAPAAPGQQKTDQFGLENRTSPVVADAIESYIPGRFEGWGAKSLIKLANGQVWQVTDDTSRYLTLNDPKVKIRRGALGAFYLEFEKVNYSPRVKRVQ